jgi:5-methylcytosine-specific restriction endonuclease McrA
MIFCLNCKKEFELIRKPGRNRKHCSDACRTEHLVKLRKSRRPEFVIRSCVNCACNFQKPRESQKKLCPSCLLLPSKSCAGCPKQILRNRKWCNSCLSAGAHKPNQSQEIRSEQDRRGRRINRERLAPGLSISKRNKLLQTWKSNNTLCVYCSNLATTVDHVIPLSRGGTNFEGNLVPACRSCNSSKGTKFLIEWNSYARLTAQAK